MPHEVTMTESHDEWPDALNRKKRPVTRRDFLRIGATASAGLAAGRLWLPSLSRAAPQDTSRVVVVTDEQVLDGSTIRTDIVRIMIDEGIKAFTGADTVSEAWRTIFPDLAADLAIGLKVNTINRYLSTHPAVTLTVAESLADTPVAMGTYPLNRMLIWDRWYWELEAAGYAINTSTSGVRCYATNSPGIGYDTATISVHGVQQRTSRCFVDHTDRMINLCLLKNHTISGVTHSLKNHYGTIHNPDALHGGHCDPYVPALNAALLDTYGTRQTLCVCDAIFGIRYGGPMGYPQFAYNGILFATDPVALDAVCRQILEEYGSNTIGMAHHIDTAGAPPYSLGNNDLENIERIEVLNPSNPVHGNPKPARPATIELGRNHPEPFTSRTTIPVTLKKGGEIRLDIHDLLGRRIDVLQQGMVEAGHHEFTWNAGRSLSPGTYVARLQANGQSRSRTITLVR